MQEASSNNSSYHFCQPVFEFINTWRINLLDIYTPAFHLIRKSFKKKPHYLVRFQRSGEF